MQVVIEPGEIKKAESRDPMMEVTFRINQKAVEVLRHYFGAPAGPSFDEFVHPDMKVSSKENSDIREGMWKVFGGGK